MPKVISNDQLSSVSMGAGGENRHWRDWDLEPNFIEAPDGSPPTPSFAPAPGNFTPEWDGNPKMPGGGVELLPSIGIPSEWEAQTWMAGGLGGD